MMAKLLLCLRVSDILQDLATASHSEFNAEYYRQKDSPAVKSK
jgi:hypothetical protein